MSGTEPPAGGPGPASESPRSESRAPTQARRAVAAGVAAAIVVALVLAGLYVGGVGPFAKSHAPPSGPETFSQAEAVGASVVGAYDGGGWSLIAAASAVVRQSEVVPLLAVETALRQDLGSCALQWLTSASSFEVPGFSGNPEAGLSPFWALVYRNASVSGSGLLFVTVSNGTAQLTALLPATGGCATDSEIASFVTPISSSVVDSPKVLSAAVAAGGGAFLSSHPTANVSLEITGAVNLFTLSEASTWDVTFSTCPLAATSSSLEPQFNATINAATGAVIFEQSVEVNCTTLGVPTTTPSTFTLSNSLAWSAGTVATSGGTYWANATVEAASSGISFGDVTISVSGPKGISPTPAWSLQAISLTGSALALYNLTTHECTAGCLEGISAGDVLSVDSSTSSLAGGSITLIGTGQWVGVEQILVP